MTELAEIFRDRFGRWLDDIDDWCRDSTWIPRVPIVLWLVAIQIYLWRDPPMRGLFDFPNLFSGINLGIHEMGHILFRALGSFMEILGGSLLQCLAPIAGIHGMLKQRDYFGACVCVAWLGTNIYSVGIYMADAQPMALPLVSPFSSHPLHDWNHLFTRMGLLSSSGFIGFMTKAFGSLVMILAIAGASWLCYRMLNPPPRRLTQTWPTSL